MGWVDKVPGAGNLYIGGLYALTQTPEIASAHITHVLSVINADHASYAAHPEIFRPFRAHASIDVEDDEDENLLRWFGEANRFIEDALAEGTGDGEGEGGVFVHCAMGKSRSATVVVAYLMWKYHLSPDEALAQLRQGRPVCGPNDGFMEQLHVYHRILQATDEEEAGEIYRRWLAGWSGSRSVTGGSSRAVRLGSKL